ncbi:hypothetical protein BBK36DRAFT_1155255 [Trichoderma citrinoviride]|uniref:RRM domain-containing protein n=1 Tax=Trichoderma citrinoviride TaxID=58853 RepID=A0A2T4BMF8_9HYPO|nr:hypothetical protein BBK36DRAFT_1155255 [Trichoderma citrinoviride]PTB70449.1 hypothetical protein BBK36DRAFT_1155255 [Trichoderma citrinoviride]
MKSKRAAAASAEDARPVDVPQDQANKKRKRSDDDADHSKDATAGQGGEKRVKKFKEERKEKKKEKKEKRKRDKEERKAKMPKKDKSKYNNKSRKEKKEELKNLQNLPEGMDVDGDEGTAQAAEAVTKPEAEAESKTNGKSEDKASKKQDKEDKKKEKKEKKKEKKERKEKENQDSSKESVPQGEDAIDLDPSAAQKAGRNIVFVGNLPYSATATSITAHFASLKPVAVRCLTKKEDPKACRGIAFVEFATPTHQRTCLDKFHHTMFDDGISPPRKINVELTAGGGGKGQGRKDKIMEKNKKLDENRAKRIEKEKTAKEENNGGSNGSARMDIHPSRLARLPGLGH